MVRTTRFFKSNAIFYDKLISATQTGTYAALSSNNSPTIRDFDQEQHRFDKLITKLDKEKCFVFRGTQGHSEINSILQHKKLGISANDPYNGLFNLFHHVIYNQSQYWFYSGTEYIDYSKHYTRGNRLIPNNGYIIVYGKPRVYAKPFDVRDIYPEEYTEVLHMLHQNEEIDMPMTKGENKFFEPYLNIPELTTILRANENDDFFPRVDTDVHSVIHIYNSGDILKLIPKSRHFTIDSIINPNFRMRKACFEMFILNDFLKPEELEAYSQKARDAKLIGLNDSLLTFQDVRTIINSSFYKDNEYRQIGDKTPPMIIMSLPSDLKKVELLDYYKSLVENPNVEISPINFKK